MTIIPPICRPSIPSTFALHCHFRQLSPTTKMSTMRPKSFEQTFMDRVWSLQLLTVAIVAIFATSVAVATATGVFNYDACQSLPYALFTSISTAALASFATYCTIVTQWPVDASHAWNAELMKFNFANSLLTLIVPHFLWPLRIKSRNTERKLVLWSCAVVL